MRKLENRVSTQILLTVVTVGVGPDRVEMPINHIKKVAVDIEHKTAVATLENDETISLTPEQVTFRLLADEAACKATFAPAAKRWVAQHGASRPVEARVSAPKTLHDRAIFVDGDKAWTLTQSLKDFAKRSPAEIVRADDTASLKIEAYELLWAGARTVI